VGCKGCGGIGWLLRGDEIEILAHTPGCEGAAVASELAGGVKVNLSVERDSKEISLHGYAGVGIGYGIGSRGENRFPGHVNDRDNISDFTSVDDLILPHRHHRNRRCGS